MINGVNIYRQLIVNTVKYWDEKSVLTEEHME